MHNHTNVLVNVYPKVWFAMTKTTTTRVSKQTAETLEDIRKKLGAQNLDETIQTLVKERRKAILEKSFGSARGHGTPFTEADRGEDRD